MLKCDCCEKDVAALTRGRLCLGCHAKIHIGFRRLELYLAKWARFREWEAAHQ